MAISPLDPLAPAAAVGGRERLAAACTYCRHTFASWAIRAGVQLFYLSRIMGTSVAQIDQTYGHLVPDSEEYLRGLLDTFDSRGNEEARLADGR